VLVLTATSAMVLDRLPARLEIGNSHLAVL